VCGKILESETFDLAGSTATTIENTIRDAFAEPFDSLHEMIRLTFVTGAGRLGRARYDENAAKAVTNTLRELGYEEDRGASAVMECAGTYKLQHDTGKNLKTVVIFPKVNDNNSNNKSIQSGMNCLRLGGNQSSSSSSSAPLILEGSIEHKIAYASMNVFPNMIQSCCPTWSQKKECINAITSLKEMAETIDKKLMDGQPLTDAEQDFYDSVSMTSIEEKMACVRDLMHKQVDAGEISASEKEQLIGQVNEKLQTLKKDIQEAEQQKKTKRVENLKTAETKMVARKVKLVALTPRPLPPLKNEAAITKLRKELKPLLEMEENAKGRLLTPKEAQTLARKDEILIEIEQLEQASRGWFESEEIFQARVRSCQENFQKSVMATKTKKSTTTTTAAKPTSALPSTTKWVTPGAKKQTAWSKPNKSTTNTGSGGLFAAMMNDSDSD
jgi:hypothetical protein